MVWHRARGIKKSWTISHPHWLPVELWEAVLSVFDFPSNSVTRLLLHTNSTVDLDWKQDTNCPVNYSDEIKKWFKLNGLHGKNCLVQWSESWEALPEVIRVGHVWFRGWLLLRVAKLKSLTAILSTSPRRGSNFIEVITLDQRCLKEGNIPLQKKLTTSLHFLQLQQKTYSDANKTQI